MINENINSNLPDFDDFELELPNLEDIENPDDGDEGDGKSNPNYIDDEDGNKQPEGLVPTDDDEIEDTLEVDENAVAAFKALVEKGVLPDDENFKGTWDEIDSRMEQLPSLVAQSLIHNAPEPTRKLIEFAYSKPDITNEDLAEFVKVYLSEASDEGLDFEDTDAVKTFLTESYTNQGLRPSAAIAAIRSLEDEDFDGTALKEEAKKLYESREKFSKTDAMIAEEKEKQEELRIEQQKFVTQVSNELTATGWSPQRINLVSQQLKENKVSQTLNKALQNPKALIQLADLSTYYDEKTNLFNFDTFIKQVATKDVERQKNNVIRDNWKNVSGGGSATINKSNTNNNLKFEPFLD